MTMTPNLSSINLEKDFQDVLDEARVYVEGNKESECLIHHINDNTIEQIKERIKECRQNPLGQSSEELRQTLGDFVAMGIANAFLKSRTYRLTRVGKKLSEQIRDPYSV